MVRGTTICGQILMFRRKQMEPVNQNMLMLPSWIIGKPESAVAQKEATPWLYTIIILPTFPPGFCKIGLTPSGWMAFRYCSNGLELNIVHPAIDEIVYSKSVVSFPTFHLPDRGPEFPIPNSAGHCAGDSYNVDAPELCSGKGRRGHSPSAH